ncbi:MAG: lysophospholipid acyltransferase family protein [Polyangiaceae bacterium]
MIPSSRSPWFVGRFSGHVRARLRRSFSRFAVAGLERTRALVAAGPFVVVSNHSAWWDPLVALHVCHDLLGAEGHAWMDAGNLARLSFFQRIGAFGVDRADPSDGARGIRHAARLLRAPGRVVWVFPQGKERPVAVRPLGFEKGAFAVARVAKVPVVPVAIDYAFGALETPEIHVAFGEPRPAPRDVATACSEAERDVEALLGTIVSARDGDGSASSFTSLWSTPKEDGVASAVLARMFPLRGLRADGDG